MNSFSFTRRQGRYRAVLHLRGREAVLYAQFQTVSQGFARAVVGHKNLEKMADEDPGLISAFQEIDGRYLLRTIIHPTQHGPEALGRAVAADDDFHSLRNTMGKLLYSHMDDHRYGLAIQDLENQTIDWGDGVTSYRLPQGAADHE